MKKYTVEFTGTFFFVLTMGMTLIEPGAGNLAPLAIGAILMVMVYVGHRISGAHYNPAITLAVWLRGRFEASNIPGYVVSQLLGATLAALVVRFLKGGREVIPTVLDVTTALLAEMIFTFALAFVFLTVLTAKKNRGNTYFGWVIGFTVVAGMYAMGSVSVGVFNPAAALGISIMGVNSWGNIWLYFIAHFLGGILAATSFNYLYPDDK
jgi:aquaporin Z